MLEGRTFSIFGDSYSTFAGFVPKDYGCYYPNTTVVDDVLCVEDTWWGRLIHEQGMKLFVNDSYSGATVCTHVREPQPPSSSFVERVHYSFCNDDKQHPDYIFVFGCTNDSWLEREIGQVQYKNWSKEDVKRVLPAFCYVLDQLSTVYINTKIVAVINTELNSEIEEGIMISSEHYGAIIVKLHDIDKQNGHPSALGMRQITEQICEMLI